MIKQNLTHKILPLLGLFLLIFSLFFTSEVHAVTSEDCGSFAPEIQEKIKSLPEFNSYDNYIAVYWNLNNANRVIVVFFNGDSSLNFYIGSHNGLSALYADSSFDAVFYGIDMSSLNVITSYPQKCNGLVVDMYRCEGLLTVFSNYDIYTDVFMGDYFYKFDSTIGLPYIKQEVGDIEYFVFGSIEVCPRGL